MKQLFVYICFAQSLLSANLKIVPCVHDFLCSYERRLSSHVREGIFKMERPIPGTLTLLEILNEKHLGLTQGKYLCFCGNEFITKITLVNTGDTKSCGCYHRALLKFFGIRRTKYAKEDKRLRNIWKAMMRRCYKEKEVGYPNYGGRGISVCQDWHDFHVFVSWARSNYYEDDLTLDRIDSDKNYEPDNCRWVTIQIQNSNRKSKRPNKCGHSGITVLTGGRFNVIIGMNKEHVRLGSYKTLEEAIEVYEKARKERDEQYLKELEERKNKPK